MINIKTAEIVGPPFQTTVRSIFTMETCTTSDSKVFLSIGGEKGQESSELSDFLDITLLCEKYDAVPKPIDLKLQISEELQDFLNEKDQEINTQKDELKNLQDQISELTQSNQGKNKA